MDLDTLRDYLESKFEFDYIESEGDNCIRFDYGDNSVWIYSDKQTEGLTTMPKAIQAYITQLFLS